MQVTIESLIDGARRARGTAVIIDVFRTATSIVAAFDAGAERIIPVADLDDACEQKRRNPSFLLFGERHGLPPQGFDAGNSPPAIARMDLHGRTIILTTSAGTQALAAAAKADEVIVGCFRNARAVCDYLAQTEPELVTLVAAGVNGAVAAPEDELCAQYIRSLIAGEPMDLDRISATILTHPEAEKFFRQGTPLYNPDDVYFSLEANASNVVPRCVPGRGLVAKPNR